MEKFLAIISRNTSFILFSLPSLFGALIRGMLDILTISYMSDNLLCIFHLFIAWCFKFYIDLPSSSVILSFAIPSLLLNLCSLTCKWVLNFLYCIFQFWMSIWLFCIDSTSLLTFSIIWSISSVLGETWTPAFLLSSAWLLKPLLRCLTS